MQKTQNTLEAFFKEQSFSLEEIERSSKTPHGCIRLKTARTTTQAWIEVFNLLKSDLNLGEEVRVAFSVDSNASFCLFIKRIDDNATAKSLCSRPEANEYVGQLFLHSGALDSVLRHIKEASGEVSLLKLARFGGFSNLDFVINA